LDYARMCEECEKILGKNPKHNCIYSAKRKPGRPKRDPQENMSKVKLCEED
ncbi:6507_t:CDS:1, partial [Acaulospora colombiana]